MSTPAVAQLSHGSPGSWQASLELAFERVGPSTVLRRRGSRGPLYVQKPFYPEPDAAGDGPVHVYVLHPPGGVAGQDELAVGIDVMRDAQVLLTTPAATKLYRSSGPTACLTHRMDIAAGASCEWLPQENIYFSGARARLSTRVRVAPGGSFFGWDVHCLGRPASGDHFAGASVDATLRIELQREQRVVPLIVERNRFCSGSTPLAAAWGQAGYTVCGTCCAYPFDEEQLKLLRKRVPSGAAGPLRTALTVVDRVLVARVLAPGAEPARRWLEQVWAEARPLVLGRPASAPRVWAT